MLCVSAEEELGLAGTDSTADEKVGLDQLRESDSPLFQDHSLLYRICSLLMQGSILCSI